MGYSAEIVCTCGFKAKGSAETAQAAVFVARNLLHGHLQGRPHLLSYEDAQVTAALADPSAIQQEKEKKG